MASPALSEGLLDDKVTEPGQPAADRTSVKGSLVLASTRTVVKGLLALGFCLAGLVVVRLAAARHQAVVPANLGPVLASLQGNTTLRRPLRLPRVAGATELFSAEGGFAFLERPGAVTFEDIEAGVLYMSRFIASTRSDPPEFGSFIAPLTDPNHVHNIFRGEHRVLHSVIPSDLDIYAVLSIFFHTAQAGTIIQENMHSALCTNLEFQNIVVTSWPWSGITDAWTSTSRIVEATIVDRAITINCEKEYTESAVESSTSYSCKAKVQEIVI